MAIVFCVRLRFKWLSRWLCLGLLRCTTPRLLQRARRRIGNGSDSCGSASLTNPLAAKSRAGRPQIDGLGRVFRLSLVFPYQAS